MTTFAVLATGPSMSQDVAYAVRGRARVIVVNDAFRLAPWAEALFASDRAWWSNNPDAMDFAGRRVSGMKVAGCEQFRPLSPLKLGCNSGLVACQLAESMGANKILLLGFDMQGAHFFGDRTGAAAGKPTPARFHGMRCEFAKWRNRAIVLNCTPGSALSRYPTATLEAALC